MVSVFSYGLSSSYRNFWNHYAGYMTGRRAYENTQKSNQAEIDYQNYLRAANERAYRDWQKNVPNRKIAYPEFSYPGQIYAADKNIARANYSTDSSYANYVGHMANTALGYARGAGLYKISGRTSRRL